MTSTHLQFAISEFSQNHQNRIRTQKVEQNCIGPNSVPYGGSVVFAVVASQHRHPSLILQRSRSNPNPDYAMFPLSIRPNLFLQCF